MIEQLRARPWSIHAFAILLLGVGLHALIGGLTNLEDWLMVFEEMLPQFPWDRDWTIIAHSARFSIVCIPVAMVWIWGRRFARTLVTLFTVLTVIALIRALAGSPDVVDAEGVAKTALIALACALLFTPSAKRWLEPAKEASDVETFD